MKILGIDPGSRLAGYGCVEAQGRNIKHLTHGTLRLMREGSSIPLQERLLSFYEGLTTVIEQFQPQVMVVENIFHAKNALSALKLGHARGVALLCAAKYGLQLAEYTPAEVKKMIVGHGAADKEQVSKMVRLVLGEYRFSTHDASDALALAICHAHVASSPIAKQYKENIDAALKD